MKTVYKAKAIVLENNIDTDQIYPGAYLELTDPKEIGSHCLSGVDKNISKNFNKGDFVVAGTNFGCGSSREHAPIALINMGASLVIAESFARIFFRNAINLGLPLIVCKGLYRKLKNGQEIEVNVEKGYVNILETGESFTCEPFSEQTIKILSFGGIKELMRSLDK